MRKLFPLAALISLLATSACDPLTDITDPPSPTSISTPTFVETAVPIEARPSEANPYPAIEAEIGEVVAHLTVPRLDMVDYPVRMGVSAEVLAYGPGVYKGTPEPGEGNFTLAGHRVTPVGPWDHGPFRYLDMLEPGDIAKVRYQGETFKYEFRQILIVGPENVSVLLDNRSDMTFTACHPPGYATERIVAQWRLMEVEN